MTFTEDDLPKIYKDNIDVTMKIAGDPWLIIEAKVELTRATVPDYVDLVMIPHPSETLPDLPNIDTLVGEKFTLDVDNDMISERDTDAEEVTRIFTGNLANISPTGKNIYEGIAYSPMHQPFNKKDAGSALNTEINIGGDLLPYDKEFQGYGLSRGTEYVSGHYIQAKDLVKEITSFIDLPEDKVNINLKKDGVDRGEFTGGFNKTLQFEHKKRTIGDILNRVRRETASEFWFDRLGNFHFGVPDPTDHRLSYIIDADAGKTTPPYQSVIVIGSGVASAEADQSKAAMVAENPTVVTATIANVFNEDGRTNEDPEALLGVDPSDLPEPVYTYRNAELTTDDQAKNTAKKIIQDLAEQQADGTVTVVGFPEVRPLDSIEMPNTDIQPMGGYSYGVYKVVHTINGTDGFTTKIHVSNPVGVTRAKKFELSEDAVQTFDAVSRGMAAYDDDIVGGTASGLGFDEGGDRRLFRISDQDN
jgi:hypothetical protein